MTLIVDYLPIANLGGANVETQAQYVIDLGSGGVLQNGYQAGLAKSNQVNKTLRQTSMVAAAVATVISNTLNVNVLDDGNLSALVANLTSAIESLNPTPVFNQVVNGGTSAGTANVQTLTASPVPGSYAPPFFVLWTVGAGLTNTSSMTVNFNGLGAKNYFKITPVGPTAMVGGETQAGSLQLAMYDGTQFQQIIGVPVPQPVGAVTADLVIVNDNSSPNTKIGITAGSAILVDASGNAVKVTTISQSIDYTTNGAGGLDTGSLGNVTWYYNYLIWNPTTRTLSCIGSLSSSAPTLPAGYTFKKRVGAVITDGSAHFMRTIQKHNEARYQVTGSSNTTNMPIMASGVAGSVGTPTFVAVAVGGFVPPTALAIDIQTQLTGGATNILIVAPNPNYGPSLQFTNPPPVNYSTGNGSTFQCVLARFVLESANIYWACQGSGSPPGAVNCMGWVDSL